MNEIFQTTAIYNCYNLLLYKYPSLTSLKSELINMLAPIKLPDKQPQYEHFCQELQLFDDINTTIPITWNIEKILQEVNILPKKNYIVKELCSFIDFNNNFTREAIEKLLPKGSIKHRSNFIVLASFPGFPGFLIIDGNHKFLEHLNNTTFSFECCILENDIILNYLEPNSKKLAEALFYITSLLV